MTVEELQAEAKKLGYRLTKIPQKPVRLLPCPICGKKNTSVWYATFDGRIRSETRRCNTRGCTFEGFFGLSDESIREGWNNAVELYLKKENK